MANAQIESDPLFQLLTDALRAGPQSAEWAQAVSRIRESGSTEADEYKALLQAREGLESGKEYKSVRAGAGFTHDLFGKIEQEKDAAKAKGLPTATLLAIGAGIVILAVIAVVVFFATREGQGGGAETLPALFPTTVVSTTFAPGEKGLNFSADGGADAATGLKPGTYASVERPIEGRFEIEADVQAAAGNAETAVVQVAVPSDKPEGNGPEKGGLTWQLFGGSQRVVLGDATMKTMPVPVDGKITVRVVVGATTAAVYANKELLWTGEHGLPKGAKLPGVGIFPVKPGATPTPAVKAIRVRTESKAAGGM